MWTIYKKFEIHGNVTEGYRITFSCDAYFEPIFSMFRLEDYGILKLKIEYGGEETDRVVISSGNLEALKKLRETNWPDDATDLVKQLETLGYKPLPKQPATGPIVINEIDHQYIVSRARWNAYWMAKGKTGPENGWEMPTYAQIMAETSDFKED